jgi:hypothetical protein
VGTFPRSTTRKTAHSLPTMLVRNTYCASSQHGEIEAIVAGTIRQVGHQDLMKAPGSQIIWTDELLNEKKVV